MLDALREARQQVATQLEKAEPDRVTTGQAVELMTLFAEIERLGAAGKVLFATRATESLAWRDEGHRSAAAWMAEKTKTGVGDAAAAIETSAALPSLPGTTEALRQGELSAPQLRVIAAAGVNHPEDEAALLEAAAAQTLKGLKERCAQLRAPAGSAKEEAARYNAIRTSRYLRHWSDADGAFRLDAKLTPDAGAKVMGALRLEADARFDEARKANERDPAAAYLADALVTLVTSGPVADRDRSSGATRATVCWMVDAAAMRRGYVKRGESCEIPGIGPVPVAAVRRQLSDAFLKVLVTDGVDVTTVCHVGRTVPAHVQSALEARDPRCVVPGCDIALGLENHHWDVPFAECGTSTLAGLARVCAWHHHVITYDGFDLVGGPGRWELRAPAGGTGFDQPVAGIDSG
jgi:hypothetical protein